MTDKKPSKPSTAPLTSPYNVLIYVSPSIFDLSYLEPIVASFIDKVLTEMPKNRYIVKHIPFNHNVAHLLPPFNLLTYTSIHNHTNIGSRLIIHDGTDETALTAIQRHKWLKIPFEEHNLGSHRKFLLRYTYKLGDIQLSSPKRPLTFLKAQEIKHNFGAQYGKPGNNNAKCEIIDFPEELKDSSEFPGEVTSPYAGSKKPKLFFLLTINQDESAIVNVLLRAPLKKDLGPVTDASELAVIYKILNEKEK